MTNVFRKAKRKIRDAQFSIPFPFAGKYMAKATFRYSIKKDHTHHCITYMRITLLSYSIRTKYVYTSIALGQYQRVPYSAMLNKDPKKAHHMYLFWV